MQRTPKPRYIDLTGQRFNRWLVLSKTPNKKPGTSRWRCVCDCGRIKEEVLYTSLVSGSSQSCGCLRAETQMKKDDEVHSHRNPMYSIWMSIKTRCYNEKHPSYGGYGARGIRMCDQWRHDFDAFREHVGKRPDGSSLDRIDNEGNYEPGNVRWSTRCEQASNTRRNIKVSWHGFICNLIDVARQEDVAYPTLLAHFKRHGDIRESVARCKAIGSKFEERSAEKLGIPQAKRKHKPVTHIEPRIYRHIRQEEETNQQLCHAQSNHSSGSHMAHSSLQSSWAAPRRASPSTKPSAPADHRPRPTSTTTSSVGTPPPAVASREAQKRRDNRRKWRAMEYCRVNGLMYRGALPSDFFDLRDSITLPTLPERLRF